VTPGPRSGQAPRIGRLPGRWLAAALIAAALALLAPGISYATASQSHQTTTASQSRQMATGCIGITPAAFPAAGFISDAARTQGGHLWWHRQKNRASVCIGTVVESVQYNSTATKTWKVTIYSTRHPHGLTVARVTFTLNRGSYSWKFRIRHAYVGLSAVCVTADDSFGAPCIHFTHPRG
jgi:hypothetical protein